MTAMDCEKIASLVHNPDAGMRVLCLDEVGRKGPLHIPLLEVRMGQEADWVFTREVVNALAMEVAARDATIKSLEEDLHSAKSRMRKAEDEVDELSDTIRDLRDEIRGLNAEVTKLSS